jgi:hypothetical protein
VRWGPAFEVHVARPGAIAIELDDPPGNRAADLDGRMDGSPWASFDEATAWRRSCRGRTACG